MITKKNNAEQVIGLMSRGKTREKTLWYCSYELNTFRQHYLPQGQFNPTDETADFCLLVMKPFQQGGMFYDVELPDGVHGLFQALDEKELQYELLRLREYNILEKKDDAVGVRRTDIKRIVSSILTYNNSDREWRASLSEYRATGKGRVFRPESQQRAFQYLEVHHPGGFRELF